MFVSIFETNYLHKVIYFFLYYYVILICFLQSIETKFDDKLDNFYVFY